MSPVVRVRLVVDGMWLLHVRKLADEIRLICKRRRCFNHEEVLFSRRGQEETILMHYVAD